MKFYLLRHAQAEKQEVYQAHSKKSDFYRPLTPSGILKFKKTAKHLRKKYKIKHILHSAFTRCQQTAEILSDELKMKAQKLPCLGHGIAIKKTLVFLKTKLKKNSVLIGHEPELSLLVAALGLKSPRPFKKGELRAYKNPLKKLV